MKKLIASIIILASVTAFAQNGSIGSGSYTYDGTDPIINILTVNVGSTSNLVLAGLQKALTIHGSSQPFGLFAYITSPVSQTNSVVLTVAPAHKVSGPVPGSTGGYLIATNQAQSVTFNYVGATNTVYAQLQSTNFYGCDSAVVTAVQSTNNVAIGTNATVTVYPGSFH